MSKYSVAALHSSAFLFNPVNYNVATYKALQSSYIRHQLFKLSYQSYYHFSKFLGFNQGFKSLNLVFCTGYGLCP